MKNREIILIIILILVIGGFFMFYNLGSGSLQSWDEAVYAQVTKQILTGNNWLTLYWNDSLFFDKPPLCMWITALVAKIVGLNEYSVRFFSALCGLGIVILVFLLGKKFYNCQVGLLSAFSLLSMKHFLKFARMGTLDIPVTFFIILGIYFFWLGRKDNNYFLLMGISFGLGFLVKNVVVLLGVFTIFIYIVLYREIYLFKNKKIWQSVGLFCLIVLPWYLYHLFTHGKAFFSHHFGFSVVQRITQTVELHSGPFLYYLNVVLHNTKPAGYIALFAIIYLLFYQWKNNNPKISLILIWCFMTFFVFSIPKTRLEWYIMPIYPSLALIIGLSLRQIFKERSVLYLIAILVLFTIGIKHLFPDNLIYTMDYKPQLKLLSQYIDKTSGSDQILAVYKVSDNPTAVFYCNRKTAILWQKEDLLKLIEKHKKLCLITKKESFERDIKSKYLKTSGIKVTRGYIACYIDKVGKLSSEPLI